MSLSVLFLIVSFSAPSFGAINDKQATDLINYYLDLVKSGNYESALDMWEQSCLGRATRLGIEYDDIPMKPDCNSFVIYDFSRIKQFIPEGLHSKAELDGNVLRWKFDAMLDSQQISHFYYTALSGNYYWLIFPQDYYCKDWSNRESKYFRFHINPTLNEYVNNIAVAALDEAVEKIAGRIGISAERTDILTLAKIDYYLCGSDLEVEKLSGVRDRGIYEPASDAIITTFIPDYHKVALLLVNFKLQKLPLFTLPFIQQGIGTLLGGRWQRSPEVILDFADYILKYNIVAVDSILNYSDFHNITFGDVTQPVGACLTDYIYTILGNDRFFDFYRSLSGNYESISTLTADSIKARITVYLGRGWDDLMTGFNAFMDSLRPQHGLIYPGDIGTDQIVIDDSGLTISSSDKWFKVEYVTKNEDRTGLIVLLNKDPQLADVKSMLFSDQLREKGQYHGYRYGIRLDKNEIGLYDYATNQILAKFVDDPSVKSSYYDDTTKKISAYFDRNLIRGKLIDRDPSFVME